MRGRHRTRRWPWVVAAVAGLGALGTAYLLRDELTAPFRTEPAPEARSPQPRPGPTLTVTPPPPSPTPPPRERLVIHGTGDVSLDPSYVPNLATNGYGYAWAGLGGLFRRADLVIVTIHWGVELDTEPRPEQVELGRAFVRAGADAIFGHHAHRLQPLEHYRGRPIFWGLGNFVWPDFSPAGAITAVAEVVVRGNGSVTGRLLPAHIEPSGHPVLLD